MNKENCALKLVDEIILYYDARSKNIKKSLRIVCHIDRRIFQAVRSQHIFQDAALVLLSEVRIFVSVYKIKANRGVEY